MLRYLTIISLIVFPLDLLAAPEPKCHINCLKDGYYALTCDSICHTDEVLGTPFKVARQQYLCMKDCELSENNTLLQCILDCRQSVRTEILTGKKKKMRASIAEAEGIVKQQQEELEKEIDNKVTSREIKYEKPPLLVIK